MIDNKKETKICPYCAEEIKIEAVKCKHCGSNLEKESNDGQIAKVSQHSSYGTFTIIAILLPIVGIILGVVYLTKDNQIDKKLGEHTLATSILFMIIWPILWFIF
ncbi:MAG: zinc ribbon domain-containing protein [Candidatus Paceibacterota bacterium]